MPQVSKKKKKKEKKNVTIQMKKMCFIPNMQTY